MDRFGYWNPIEIKIFKFQILMYIYFLNLDNNLGHGSYLISSNGYSWSHTEQANNIAVVSFKFKEGDLIQLEY